MVEAILEKRRGKRGGKKHRAEAALSTVAEVTTPTAIEVPVAVIDNPSSIDIQSVKDITVKKKVRRGNRGKNNAVEPVQNTVDETITDDSQQDKETVIVESTSIPHMNHETRSYFIELEKKLDTPEFDDEEDRDIFITNLYKEIDGHEIAMAADFDGSRILEKLMPLSSDFHLRILGSRLLGSFSKLFCHKFASHVCQSYFAISANLVHRELSGESVIQLESTELSLKTMTDIVLELCTELSTEWPSLISDQYASHIMRVLLCLLSGTTTAESQLRSVKSQKFKNQNSAGVVTTMSNKRSVPKAFTEALANISASIASQVSRRDLRMLAVNPVASPVLQLFVTINGIEQAIVNNLLDTSEISDSRSSYASILMKDRVGSHLFEKIVESCTPLQLGTLYSTHFQDKLEMLCVDSIANYIIQKLIVKADAQHLDMIVVELVPSLRKLLFNNRGGVVEKLVTACLTQQTSTQQIFDGICEALEVKSPAESADLAGCMLCIRTPKDLVNINIVRSNTLHGSLIIQQFLSYPAHIAGAFEASFSNLNQPTLKTYLKHKSLSRSIESFLRSPSISIASKNRVCETMYGEYADLSKDTYACHFVERCWDVVDSDHKAVIMKELEADRDGVMGSRVGKIVFAKCRGKGGDGGGRKRKVFADFWEGVAGIKKKKKDV